jgi:hypothetical protein
MGLGHQISSHLLVFDFGAGIGGLRLDLGTFTDDLIARTFLVAAQD